MPATSPTWASPGRPACRWCWPATSSAAASSPSWWAPWRCSSPRSGPCWRAIVVNKFRGDPALFEGGHPVIEQRTGLRSLGVVTWFEPARACPRRTCWAWPSWPGGRAGGDRHRGGAASAAAGQFRRPGPAGAPTPRSTLLVLEPGEPLPARPTSSLLPGSKSTLADLAALRAEGWDIDIRRPCPPRRLGPGPVRRLPDARAQHRRPAGARGAGRRPWPAWACWRSTPSSSRSKTLALREARELGTGEAGARLRDPHGPDRGPGRERPMLQLEGGTDGAVSRGRPGAGLLPARAARRRRLPPGAAGADSRPRRPPAGLRGRRRGGAGRPGRASRALPGPRSAAGDR